MGIIEVFATDSQRNPLCRRVGGIDWRPMARPDEEPRVTIELSPRPPEDERPSDYPRLAAEQVDLENVINELVLRLADHKYRWDLYEFGLTDS